MLGFEETSPARPFHPKEFGRRFDPDQIHQNLNVLALMTAIGVLRFAWAVSIVRSVSSEIGTGRILDTAKADMIGA